jgi:hypothetical protein
MAGILKVDKYQDFNGNDIMTSDGSGNITINAAAMKNTPAFLVRLGSTQTVGNNSVTKLAFDTEDLDTNNAYDTSNYRFTVPSGQAGTYVFTLNTGSNSGSDFEPMYGAIFLNGSAIQYGYGRNEYYDSRNLTRQLVLSVGDYVEAYLYQNSGGNVTVQTDPATSNFFGHKLIGA